jgi:hypothetical protein
VKGVLPIPAAVLLHLDPLSIVLLIFHGDVVPALANLARQSDLDTLLVLCHGMAPFSCFELNLLW